MAAQEVLAQAAPLINSGDNAWTLMSCALVLLMTPGLSLFYAGLVPSRNAINTMNMSFICLAVVPIVWVIIGYSLAFAAGNGFIGSFHYAFLNNVTSAVISGGSVPEYNQMIFQLMFAIVTPALISGAMVTRMRFKAYIVFVALWSVFVYSIVAHWVWTPTGWLNHLGAIDFAGGTVVHINAGFSALVATVMLTKSDIDSDIGVLPHNIPLVILGSSLLWFGWFGFNAGSAGGANAVASLAFTTTTLAAAASVFAWMILAWAHAKPITAVGSAIAVVVGLVAVTPASGYVSPLNSMIIGAAAAIICFYAIEYKSKIIGKIEDPLDVFICHGISGVVGSLLTGVFASKLMNPNGQDGLLYGNPSLLYDQFIAVVATIFMCTTGTAIILLILKRIMVIDPTAIEGGAQSLDVQEHGESAYELNTIVKELFESKKTLQDVNSKLTEEVAERKRAELKAASLNNQLVVAARRAGMTDIATSVLHNIGNVLNSINTSVAMVDEKIRASEVGSLQKLKDLLKQFENNPAELFLKDARGPKVIQYITIIAEAWSNDEKYILHEMKELEKNILHIKNIINMQQSLSATIGITEETSIKDLVEDALTLNKTAYERADIEIVKNYEELDKVVIDRVKLLQIIVNLIKNSIDSLLASDTAEKRLTLSIQKIDTKFFEIKISDNGLGIEKDNLTKIFSYGFTTKKNGHGFGLHTSALAAKEMGGSLNALSDGAGLGASFVLNLPFSPIEKGKKNVTPQSETYTVG